MVVNGLSVLRLVGCILVLATAILCSNPPRLSAVMLTTWKDHKVFEASIRSAIRYMHEIDHFYVVTPNVQDFTKNLNLGSKVTFIHDNVFPFSFDNITNTMFDAVREKGRYNLTGETSFEKIVWGRWTWYLQQLIKLHAGRVLNLEDYLLLDSDLVWFRNVTFINHTDSQGITKYNYASSSQYHPPYMATLKRIAGVDIFDSSKNGGENVFRSGICHHMVIVKSVLEDLANSTERLHGNIPFWKVLLRESAFELTCRAPSEKICGAGSTLSEYELYFNFARVKHPETVAIRPLLWANGPMPGLQYWPNLDNPHSAVLTKHWDRERSAWFSHRMPHALEAFKEQQEADALQGYHFVGYHGYSKRRYYELVDPDYKFFCVHANIPRPAMNSTCSWKGFEDRANKSITKREWFDGCACYMITLGFP